MKCDKCKKNEANFHKVCNINGKVSETHLCSECAKNSKDFDFDKEFDSFNVGGKSFFDDIMSDFKTSLSYFTNPVIDNFLDFPDFSEDFFGDRILPEKVTENRIHKPEVLPAKSPRPVKLSDEEKRKLEIQKLDLELKKAVVEERYEDAVKFRDKLKELRNKK